MGAAHLPTTGSPDHLVVTYFDSEAIQILHDLRVSLRPGLLKVCQLLV